jgi:hypothetical protein
MMRSIILLCMTFVVAATATAPHTIPRGGQGWFGKDLKSAVKKGKDSAAFAVTSASTYAKDAKDGTTKVADKALSNANKAKTDMEAKMNQKLDDWAKTLAYEKKRAKTRLEAETTKLKNQAEKQQSKMHASIEQLQKKIKELEAKA